MMPWSFLPSRYLKEREVSCVLHINECKISTDTLSRYAAIRARMTMSDSSVSSNPGVSTNTTDWVPYLTGFDSVTSLVHDFRPSPTMSPDSVAMLMNYERTHQTLWCHERLFNEEPEISQCRSHPWPYIRIFHISTFFFASGSWGEYLTLSMLGMIR